MVAVQEKTGMFKGLVIARKHGSQPGATFTVRATVAGVGMEKVYPLHSPAIMGVKIVSKSEKVRRAKLYFLRKLSKKNMRRKLGVAV